MAAIAIIATSPSYIASLGAMVDAHARLGEIFATNAALGDYARMQTELVLLSATPGAITLAGGRQIPADKTFGAVNEPRIIYLPSFQLPDTAMLPSLLADCSAFHRWLRVQADRGAVIAGVGAAVFHLAAVGLLEGTPVAVPPRLVGAMRTMFPCLQPDVDNTIRHGGNIWTCSRDIDSAALVARLFVEAFSFALGRGIAMREPPGDAAGPLCAPLDPVVARAQLWIRERFTHHFRIGDLARDLGVSHQLLIRRFRDAGGASPREFVQNTRIDAATSMLSETCRSISEIAQLVGYSDVAAFRRVFVSHFGMPPGAWRKRNRSVQRSDPEA